MPLSTFANQAFRTLLRARPTLNAINNYRLSAAPPVFALLLFSTPSSVNTTGATITHHAVCSPKTSLNSTFSPISSPKHVLQIITDTCNDIHSKLQSLIKRQLASDGGRDVLFITAVNVAIYAMWKVVPSNFMHRHFTTSVEGVRRARFWTCATSNFSHRGIFHLGANMYVLNSYGPDVADVLATHRFFLYYGTAGVASSLASLSFRRLTRNNYLSLGASGAVAATLWLNASLFPNRRMSLLGSDYVVSMQEFALAFTVMDVAGLLGSAGKIDFAAHLGGAVFANVWFQLVRDKLVQEQKQRADGKQWTLKRFISRHLRSIHRKESP